MDLNQAGGAFEVLDQITASERKRDAVIAAHEAALKEAKDKLDLARKEYDDAVAEKNDELSKVRDSFYGFRMAVGPVSLYGNRIDVAGSSIDLDHSVQFEVSTSGSTYSTTEVNDRGLNVGGAVVGGLIAGPAGAVVGGQKRIEAKTKVHDGTKLFLTVVSDEGSAVAEVPSTCELDLRKLVAEARHLAKTLDDRDEKYLDEFSKASAELDAVKANTEKLDLALARYEEVESDTVEVDAAKAAHDEFMAGIDPAEIKTARRAKTKRDLKRAYMVFAYLTGALFLACGIQLFADGEALAGVIGLLITDALFTTATMVLRDEQFAKKKLAAAAEEAGE